MLILFNKISGKRLTDFGTNSIFPEGVLIETVDLKAIANAHGISVNDIVEYRLHDQEQKTEVQEIFDSATVEAIISLDKVTETRKYKRITIETDNVQILANGETAATITAQVDDIKSTETIEFLDGDGNLIQNVACIGGRAQLPVMATVPGEIVIVARSTTKYGQNSVTIKAV
jgi:hypothetical protein